MVKPLVAPREHLGDQPLQAGGIVVQPGKRLSHAGQCRLVKQCHGFGSRLGVERTGFLRHRRLCAETAQQRHLPRERRAQRVDGENPQPLRLGLPPPTALGRARQDRARELEGDLPMDRLRGLAARRHLQAGQNAIAHFGRRLAGESDRYDLLGMLDAGQQHQKTLCDELGLARARRRLDDK